jgi:hypothetical protein
MKGLKDLLGYKESNVSDPVPQSVGKERISGELAMEIGNWFIPYLERNLFRASSFFFQITPLADGMAPVTEHCPSLTPNPSVLAALRFAKR